jgi:hypothetical protein
MNHELWSRVAARVVAIAFLTAGLAACGEKLSNVSSGGPSANPQDASTKVIGTTPAEPSGDTPQTTAVAPNTTDIPPSVASKGGPREGDNHSYSTVAPNTPQKSDGKDPQQQPERKAQ